MHPFSPPTSYNKNGSHIKVCLVVVLHLLLAVADHILRVKDNILLLQLLVEEVEVLIIGGIVVESEEAMLHLHRDIVVLFDRHRRLLLHLTQYRTLHCLLFIAHEQMAHLFLFFSSILHRLEVTREGRRTT